MAAPPARTALADTYPNPSNAVFRTGIGALWDYVTERLGLSGNAADARTALGIGSVISNRNLLLNSNFTRNERAYVSATATTVANQYTLDRWRVVTSGQSLSFGAGSPDRTVTAPAGGIEQPIPGDSIEGGIYTLSWVGTATATVNGVAITNGGNTTSLPANTNAIVRFSGGTVTRAQFELGTVATPYERRLPGLEAMLCKKFGQKIALGFVGPVTSGTIYGGFANLPVEMRATPSYTLIGDQANSNFGGGVNPIPVDAVSLYFSRLASGTGNGSFVTAVFASAEI